MKVFLTIRNINEAARELYRHMARHLGVDLDVPSTERPDIKIWGVPRGGVPVALLLQSYGCEIVERPEDAQVIVDDLIDSGATRNRYPCQLFGALFRKPRTPIGVAGVLKVGGIVVGASLLTNSWVVFPWEASEEKSADDIITRLLQFIGEDPQREGLKETPARVIKAWRDEWASGYAKDPKEVLKAFKDGGEKYDEMIVVRDIPVYTHCEHHLAPFFGVAHVGYIPNGRIAGLSKLARVVDIYARRLQVQERLTAEIAGAIETGLGARGVGVVLQCRHLCMEGRGICKQGTTTITSKLGGVMYEDARTRAEFFQLIGVNDAKR